MKRLLFLFILFSYNLSFSQGLSLENQVIVKQFIERIKTDNADSIKTFVGYPLNREYPLPDIANAADFVSHYNELFDDSLKAEIINSDIINDWDDVGWRGIMLNHGTLWIDYEGNLKAINYQSELEKEKIRDLNIADRAIIHESISEFDKPILEIQTSKFTIRIDKISDNAYRYASWPIGKTKSEKPDLILSNGEYVADGTGGNHKYVFKNGIYTYECSINVIGTHDTPPAYLSVFKNETEIVSQAAKIIGN